MEKTGGRGRGLCDVTARRTASIRRRSAVVTPPEGAVPGRPEGAAVAQRHQAAVAGGR